MTFLGGERKSKLLKVIAEKRKTLSKEYFDNF